MRRRRLFCQACRRNWCKTANGTEYSDLIVAIRIVDSLEAAIRHTNRYGSHHTDSILTENAEAAKRFLEEVDSATVCHNCSTRFADGFRFGFGAEVGISTASCTHAGRWVSKAW